MPIGPKVTEKPGGARNVSRWDCRIQRDYRPHWALGEKRPVLYDVDQATVIISVEFWDGEAAAEFQEKIIKMLPEAGDGT